MGNKLIETVYLSNVSLKKKTSIKKNTITAISETELIPERLFEQQPPRLMGVGRIGVLDSRVKDYARTFYKPESEFTRPNRLRIDCLVKEAKIFNSLNFQPKDIEIVDISLKAYSGNKELGINQLFIILDEINQAGNSMSLNFSGEGGEGLGDIVYDVLKRLSIYKQSYWAIYLITLRLSHLEHIIKQKDSEKVVRMLSSIPNICIIIDDVKDMEGLTNNLRKSKMELKVLMILNSNPKVKDTYGTMLANNINSNLVVAESSVIEVLSSNQKYIELVTKGSPVRPIMGLPFPIHFNDGGVKNIVKEGTTAKLIMADRREIILMTPNEKPTIVLVNLGNKEGTKIIRSKYHNILLLDEITDLPFIITSRLQELVKIH